MWPRGAALVRAAIVLVFLAIACAHSDVEVCGSVAERFAALSCVANASTCTVTGRIRLPPGWVKCTWASTGALVLAEGASIGCANRTARSQTQECMHRPSLANCLDSTCELRFAFDKRITLLSGSTLTAGTVQLTTKGRIFVSSGAAVLANGTGLCARTDRVTGKEQYEQRMGNGLFGAGHGGVGGSCDRPYVHDKAGLSYGDATAPLDLGGKHLDLGGKQQPYLDLGDKQPRLYADMINLYGSGTKFSQFTLGRNNQCCGGGAIILNATAGVQMDGILNADAQVSYWTCACTCTCTLP